jgi:hypothetical protein
MQQVGYHYTNFLVAKISSDIQAQLEIRNFYILAIL